MRKEKTAKFDSGSLTLRAALLAAGFNHIYIWVHYFTTELPDIRFIYSGSANWNRS